MTRPSVTRDELIRRSEEFACATERMRRDGTLEQWRRNLVARRAQRPRRIGEPGRMTEDELLARVERALDRNSVALERHEQITDEHRLFIREMTLRSEKLGRELVREIRESRERWSDELRIEMVLQRDVMLRILDRLPEPGGTN